MATDRRQQIRLSLDEQAAFFREFDFPARGAS